MRRRRNYRLPYIVMVMSITFKTHAHPNSTFRYTMSSLLDLMTWDATDHIDLIDQPLLLIAGSDADTKYMSDEAFEKATGTKDKEMFLIP